MALNPLDLAARKTAVQLNLPESLVELVIAYKWKEVHQAQYDNKSIEDSGLCTFSIRTRVVEKNILKINSMLAALNKQLQDGNNFTEKQIARKEEVIQRLIEQIQYLETKL